jgi:hypothetical protein
VTSCPLPRGGTRVPSHGQVNIQIFPYTVLLSTKHELDQIRHWLRDLFTVYFCGEAVKIILDVRNQERTVR